MESEVIRYLKKQGLNIPKEHHKLLTDRWENLLLSKQKIKKEELGPTNIFLKPITRGNFYE